MNMRKNFSSKVTELQVIRENNCSEAVKSETVTKWSRKQQNRRNFQNWCDFLNFNMFRRYIRHRQCDGYESLQLVKRTCYNVQDTLHCVGNCLCS